MKKGFGNMELYEIKGGREKKKKREKKAIQGSIFFGGENFPKCKKRGADESLFGKKWI